MADKELPFGRGRGRHLFQHTNPFHLSDQLPREPQQLTQGPPRAPFSSRQIISFKPSSPDPSQHVGRRGVKVPTVLPGPDLKRVIYPEARPDNLRGTIRETSKNREQMLHTRPKEITSKVGTRGQKITCEANYFRLDKRPNWNIYQYRVFFLPEVHSIELRRILIGLKRGLLGGFLFDGTKIYLTKQIEGNVLEYFETIGDDKTEYKVIIKSMSVISMTHIQSVRILNLILHRAMDGLKMKTIGRNKFDPAAAVRVQGFGVDIWPGYITSIRQHEQEILLCVQISHKVMRSDTILDVIKRIRSEGKDWKASVEKHLLGATVLTKYNNKTYRIDEITYDVKPADTFKMRGNDITYVQYYKQRYQIDIREPNQPMLVCHVKKKYLRPGMTRDVLLVPEICNATDLTDEMKSNFRTMRELAQYTKVGPACRIERLLEFNRRLQNTPQSMNHLKDWNLSLNEKLVEIPARVLPYPDILFADSRVATNSQGDWQYEFRHSQMPCCIELKRWYLITPSKARQEAEDFVIALQRAGVGMKFLIKNPRIEELPNDIQTAVSSKIQECANHNPQLIMCIVSNDHLDRYSTIKKRCYLDFGIPSQILVHKTITPKDKTKGIGGLMSIATKVAIQMNTKLGGLPWLIDIPLTGMMTIGYDVCHDPSEKAKSWGAMVASMDMKKNSEFFSAVNRHSSGEELSNFMGINIQKALIQYYEINGTLPARILFFRDGVSDGQIRYVVEMELVALKKAIKELYEKKDIPEPKLLYLVVTKRINTRIFFDRRNPDVGTCVDDVITLPERYDFYLIPQSVREGTVTPTGFNVIHDTFGLLPDQVQQLTFRFTYFYFNYSGTVRVPALCLYAHKLAYIASQAMQASPTGDVAHRLERTLYFL